MSKKRLIRNAALTVSILATSVTFGFAQDKEKPSEDPTTKARKVGKEKDRIYSEWTSKDVGYIITGDEKKAYKALKTDEERENFIENFWRRR
ncbi:MAG: hypothetical protein M3367_08685, partial [Acidobacteriota bacterium]|nr:hypothetical protein [Acidobacteriota bacterium]